MHLLRPASQLLSQYCKASISKPLISTTSPARHLHLNHSRRPVSRITESRSLFLPRHIKSSVRYTSSDSSSSEQTSAYRPDNPSSPASPERPSQTSNYHPATSSSAPETSTSRPNASSEETSQPSSLYSHTNSAIPLPKSNPPLPPRWEATHPSSKPSWVTEPSGIPDPTPSAKPDEPAYALAFTCKPKEYECGHRAWHRVSKQGYHYGTVLIRCPGCGGRHLISDHLKIFSDSSVTIEDLMKQNGELVQRGSISDDSDVEFWDKNAVRRKELKLAAGIKRREEQAVEEGYVK